MSEGNPRLSYDLFNDTPPVENGVNDCGGSGGSLPRQLAASDVRVEAFALCPAGHGSLVNESSSVGLEGCRTAAPPAHIGGEVLESLDRTSLVLICFNIYYYLLC